VDTRVRVGDLVAFGPGVTPPDLIRMPEPIFPTLAKRLNRGAVVEVRVLVDEKGQVQQTELAGQKAGYGFDQAAVEAAGRATYKPATKDGVRVKMWTVMKVRFEP
jgi:protein TonB